MKRRKKSSFANVANPNEAIYSDRGAINPILGNRSDAATAKTFPPTSGMTGVDRNGDTDYFRAPAQPPGQYPAQPDPSLTTGRVALSVRMRWNPIKNLTFERLVGYLDQWQLGYFRMCAPNRRVAASGGSLDAARASTAIAHQEAFDKSAIGKQFAKKAKG